MAPKAAHPLASQPALHFIVTKLHAVSLKQELEASSRGSHFPKTEADDLVFEERLVALDEPKAIDMYLILRAMGATRVVEAGTSYGVSLLWLLAAVTSNSSPSSSSLYPPLVVGTELSQAKADIALSHVRTAFASEPLPPSLNLLVGDLLTTLPALNLPDRSVDALLLDIWAPVALPTLKVLLPKLRKGAVVFIDNSMASEERYAELLGFIRTPENGFSCSTLREDMGGFDICVYLPDT